MSLFRRDRTAQAVQAAQQRLGYTERQTEHVTSGERLRRLDVCLAMGIPLGLAVEFADDAVTPVELLIPWDALLIDRDEAYPTDPT